MAWQIAIYPFETIDSPGVLTTLLEVYDEGYRRSAGGDFLGHRPILSKKPLKYANHYVWQTWPQVDVRRRALGSGLHKLFQTKELVGGQYETVGLWSKNCPSTFLSLDLCCTVLYRRACIQIGFWSILHARHTTWFLLRFTTRSARIQSVCETYIPTLSLTHSCSRAEYV